MKKVEIKGIAKIDVYKSIKSDYASVDINSVKLESLIVDHMLNPDPQAQKDSKESIRETAFCRVTISIEPYTEALSINGKEIPIEF